MTPPFQAFRHQTPRVENTVSLGRYSRRDERDIHERKATETQPFLLDPHRAHAGRVRRQTRSPAAPRTASDSAVFASSGSLRRVALPTISVGFLYSRPTSAVRSRALSGSLCACPQ